MGVVLTLPKEKKKKEEPAVIVDKDKIRVMSNSPTVQSSHYEPPVISGYYPAGQRILKKKGYDEYNYENYMKVFGDDIKDNDKEILNSSDKTRIRDNMINNAGMQSFLTILYYLLLIVLVGGGYHLYNMVKTSLNIDNNKIIVSNFWDMLISLIVFIVIFYIAWRVKKEEIISKKTREGGRLREDELP